MKHTQNFKTSHIFQLGGSALITNLQNVEWILTTTRMLQNSTDKRTMHILEYNMSIRKKVI